MKILVTDSLAPEGLAVFNNADGFEVDVKLGLKSDELKKICGDYDGWVIRSGTKITAELIEAAKNLKVIGRAGVGYENIDADAATKRGIVVMNTPGGNNVTTGEHTIALMMALARHIPQAVASLKSGKWDRNKFIGVELCNKTIGVIGLGNVGRIVAERAAGLKMKVIGYDPFIAGENIARMGVEPGTLKDVFTKSDFITVHVPLTPETQGLINRAAFAKMKSGVRIINCARGGIVDEQDLADAPRLTCTSTNRRSPITRCSNWNKSSPRLISARRLMKPSSTSPSPSPNRWSIFSPRAWCATRSMSRR
jgi:D-3-phosphoglycerate dehydrogenase / 2-oxoglutarate reductase